jgi:hypothetical protein
MTVGGCCSATSVYIPPMVIFREIRFLESYTQDLLAVMTESGYINEDVFLEWLQQFQKHLTSGKCLLILDGHMSHCFLEALHYCRQQHIEMLCLPPHMTHALQPLDRTVYIPLNSYYHHEATAHKHNHPQASINKSKLRRLNSAAWSKNATVD